MKTLNKSGDTMLNREWVTRLVQKYYLGGLFKQVRWTCKKGVLQISEITNDKKLMISVQGKCNLKEFSEIPIPNTGRLLKLLSVFDDGNVVVDILDPSDYGLEYVMSPTIELADQRDNRFSLLLKLRYDFLYPIGELPKVRQWDFEDSFNTIDFLKYIRRYGTRYTNRVDLEDHPEDYDYNLFIFGPVKWFCFNGFYLRKILESNTDVKVCNLRVSKEGLSSISFQGPIKSEYFMVEYVCP
jgi:hypothetical protein